jgi:hypothetical protein
MRNIGTLATGGLLLVGLLLPLTQQVTLTGCAGHMQSVDQMKPCFDHFGARIGQAQKDSDALREMSRATAGHACALPADFPKGHAPTWVVMRKLDGSVVGVTFDQAWAMAKAGAGWTVSVCE